MRFGAPKRGVTQVAVPKEEINLLGNYLDTNRVGWLVDCVVTLNASRLRPPNNSRSRKRRRRRRSIRRSRNTVGGAGVVVFVD